MAMANKNSSPRLIPFFTFVVTVLLLLKMTNIWVGISEVSAGHFFGRQATSETSIPQVTTSNSHAAAQETLPAGGGINTGQPSSGADDISDRNVIARPTHNDSDNERLLEHLGSRRKELDEREASLKVREDLLKAAEIKLEEKLSSLEDKREELKSLEAERARLNSERVEALVSTYERMKPRDAARIFELLENDLLILVAGKMRTQALAGILAEMSPTRAHILTRLISEDGAVPDSTGVNNSATAK